jgi:hypothetical protein
MLAGVVSRVMLLSPVNTFSLIEVLYYGCKHCKWLNVTNRVFIEGLPEK